MTSTRLLTTTTLVTVVLAGGVVHAGTSEEPPATAAKKPRSPGSEEPHSNEVAGPLTTDVWREPRAPLELHWELLALPERAVELAFMPVAMLVTVVEHYRLDRRIHDLLRNDEGTIVVTPNAKLSLGDGFGAGASLRVKSTEANEQQLRASALYRLNGDYEAGVDLRRNLIRAEGRQLELRFEHEVDRDMPYYGIGPETAVADERVVRSDALHGSVAYELQPRGALDLTGWLSIGYRKERLSGGEELGVIPVGVAGDSVPPPPGFERWSDYVTARAHVGYDTRDVAGRPSRGWTAELEAAVTQEIDGQSLSAGAGSLTTTVLLPLLPERRVLSLSAGVRLSDRLSSGDEVPLHELTELGRDQHLRGYKRARFRDRHGWWATAEYGFPIYEYANTGVALDASLFVDVGHVAGGVTTLFEEPVRTSAGVGLRAAHEVLSIFRLDLAWSPEGVEFSFSLGRFD